MNYMSLSEQGAPTGRSTLFLYIWLQQRGNSKNAGRFRQNAAKVILFSVLFAKSEKSRVQTVENQV
ncbi:hypothetical protein RX411_03520 [Faecalibacterium prausnitzii]|jgi:hypothetical protein|nr:hypothetical protein [Faecalibacterium prausnitzii]